MRDESRVGFDWALSGAQAWLAGGPIVAVVVDVLSFSTTVSVAADRGIEVFPFHWHDDRAADYAASVGAEVAHGRRHGGVSLSPASIRHSSGLTRLVLPSPNGASISATLAGAGAVVVSGCLRNAAAVGAWLAERLAQDPSLRMVALAAGERWPDGSLRPAVEDLWGAGAVLAALAEQLPSDWFSPEARTAQSAFALLSKDVLVNLTSCVSGRELVDYGFAADVAIAAELNQSACVPVLSDGAFRASAVRPR